MDAPSQATQKTNADFSMHDLLEESDLDLPKISQLMTGEIMSAGKNAVLVDLGPLGTGIIYPGEFYDNQEMQKSLKPGQKISAILLDIENEEGYRELSLRQAQKTTSWEDVRNKKDSGEIIETKIVNLNKGGLIVEINGIQGFLPLSQLAPEHYPKVEGGDTTKIVQALQKMRGTDIKIKILDFSEQENRLIVSEKAIYEDKIKDQLANFKVGDVVDAEITDVTDFGAFALIQVPASQNIEDAEKKTEPQQSTADDQANITEAEQTEGAQSWAKIEGLIHISEIDWGLVENPRDFLKQGDKVKAKIMDISGDRVSLSLKQLNPNPWEKVENKYKVGETVEGKVAKVTNPGLLVQLDEEVAGLIPLVEFSEQRPIGGFGIGDSIKVAVVSIDPIEHKILLTLQEDAPTLNPEEGQK